MTRRLWDTSIVTEDAKRYASVLPDVSSGRISIMLRSRVGEYSRTIIHILKVRRCGNAAAIAVHNL